VLTRLFATTPLDFFVAFSSISAVVPSAGSADYAAACSYLDAFVLSSHRPAAWRRVLAIAWDAWHSVGMAERVVVPDAMGQARRTYLAAKIAPAQGAEAFGRMLAAGLPQYVVSPHDIGGLLSAWRRSDTETSRAEAPPALHEEEPVRVAAPPLMATLLTPPPDTVEKTLASIWAELLGLAAVAMDDNFFELGGHSLLATRVLARIDRDFGVQLPLRIIFERPTIRELAEAITVRAADEGLQVHEDPAGDREVFEL
jgi:acyl carrier protein